MTALLIIQRDRVSEMVSMHRRYGVEVHRPAKKPPVPKVRLAGDHLTATEERVLAMLQEARGRVVLHGELAREALGYDWDCRGALKAHICNLRRKIGRENIVTVKPHGYRWAK